MNILEDMKELFISVFISVFITVLIALFVIGLAFVVIIPIKSKACEDKASLMNKEHSYGIFKKCMIKDERGWIPLSNYRIVN